MHKERETATDDAREVRGGGIRLNRHNRRAAAKVERQIAEVDRQIEKLEKKGDPDAR